MIETLLNKRAIDATVGDIAEAVASMIKPPQEILSEHVDKAERNKILCALSDSTANGIMAWGKKNGLDVRKGGHSFWNREDLVKLKEAYDLLH